MTVLRMNRMCAVDTLKLWCMVFATHRKLMPDCALSVVDRVESPRLPLCLISKARYLGSCATNILLRRCSLGIREERSTANKERGEACPRGQTDVLRPQIDRAGSVLPSDPWESQPFDCSVIFNSKKRYFRSK